MESFKFINQFVVLILGGFLLVSLSRCRSGSMFDDCVAAVPAEKIIIWLELWYKASGI
jgi:hypothetical protein